MEKPRSLIMHLHRTVPSWVPHTSGPEAWDYYNPSIAKMSLSALTFDSPNYWKANGSYHKLYLLLQRIHLHDYIISFINFLKSILQQFIFLAWGMLFGRPLEFFFFPPNLNLLMINVQSNL